MTEKHWAYCPDRNGVCAIVIADAERAERDAARIADLGKQLSDLHVLADFYKDEGDFRRSERDQARAELDRVNAECNAWSSRAKIAEANLKLTMQNMARELRDAERENAALRRRLREGGR
jgi:tRNA1(Val) A37 N6-methylase TrmN6